MNGRVKHPIAREKSSCTPQFFVWNSATTYLHLNSNTIKCVAENMQRTKFTSKYTLKCSLLLYNIYAWKLITLPLLLLNCINNSQIFFKKVKFKIKLFMNSGGGGLNVWFSNLGFNSTLYLDLLRSLMYKFDTSSVRDCICIFFSIKWLHRYQN